MQRAPADPCTACAYPYPWSVVPYLPGVPAAQASSFEPAGAAAAVGNFAANVALLTGQAGQDQAERDTMLRVWDTALAAPGPTSGCG